MGRGGAGVDFVAGISADCTGVTSASNIDVAVYFASGVARRGGMAATSGSVGVTDHPPARATAVRRHRWIRLADDKDFALWRCRATATPFPGAGGRPWRLVGSDVLSRLELGRRAFRQHRPVRRWPTARWSGAEGSSAKRSWLPMQSLFPLDMRPGWGGVIIALGGRGRRFGLRRHGVGAGVPTIGDV